MELNLQPIELEGVSKERPLIIAGPCSAETEEQVISTATQLANKGIKIFRAGIWKPRTKPGGFEGIGVDGLAWMKRVKQETGIFSGTCSCRFSTVQADECGCDYLGKLYERICRQAES